MENNEQETKKRIIEEAKKMLIKQTPKGKRPTKAAVAFALMAAATTLGIAVKNIKGMNDKSGSEYIITYDYTNKYTKIPDNNKVIRLNVGEVKELELSAEQYRNPVEYNGETIWEPVEEGKNMYASKWFSYEYGEDDQSENQTVYTPSQALDIYQGYISKSKEPVKFRSQPTINDNNIIGIVTGDDICYVNTDRKYKFENGKEVVINNNEESPDGHNWCRAMVKKIDESGAVYYSKGYISSEFLKPIDSENVLGVVNSSTYARTYPKVTELEGEIISDRLNNGHKIKVVKTHNNNGEEWLECMDEEKNTFYVAGYSSKPVSNFETRAKITEDGVAIKSYSTNRLNTALKDENVLVDTDKNYDGYYLVYNEDHNYTGYIDGKYIMFENGKLLVDETTTTTQSTDNSISTTHQESTNTETPKTTTQTEMPNDRVKEINDELVFAIDLSTYTNYDSFKETIDMLKKDKKVRAVIFETGTTAQRLEFALAPMYDSDADLRDFNNGIPNNSLQKGYEEIKEKMENPNLYKSSSKNFGQMDNFIKFVEYALDNNLAVGFYDYTGPITPKEASACAAHAYNIMNKLKVELGDKLSKGMVMPYIIDIETQGQSRNDAGKKGSGVFVEINGKQVELTQRENAYVEFIKLMGKGTDNPNCFAISGIDPKNGYHLYDENYVIYGDISSSIDSLVSIEHIQAALPEYNMYNWMTRSIVSYFELNRKLNEQNYNAQGLFDPEQVVNYFNKNKHISSNGRKGELADKSELFQYGLEGISINNHGYDISVTTKRNLYAVCGLIEYKDENNFREDINHIVNGDNKKEVSVIDKNTQIDFEIE